MRIETNRYITIIVFIISAGLLGAAVLRSAVMKTTVRASDPAPTQHDVWVGDVLPALPNYSWEEHDHSVVVALRVECPYCKASAPFYRQLQAMVARAPDRV